MNRRNFLRLYAGAMSLNASRLFAEHAVISTHPLEAESNLACIRRPVYCRRRFLHSESSRYSATLRAAFATRGR